MPLRYTVFQCLGGLSAGATYYAMTGHTFTLAPVGNYSWGPAMVCEFLSASPRALCYWSCAPSEHSTRSPLQAA